MSRVSAVGVAAVAVDEPVVSDCSRTRSGWIPTATRPAAMRPAALASEQRAEAGDDARVTGDDADGERAVDERAVQDELDVEQLVAQDGDSDRGRDPDHREHERCV